MYSQKQNRNPKSDTTEIEENPLSFSPPSCTFPLSTCSSVSIISVTAAASPPTSAISLDHPQPGTVELCTEQFCSQHVPSEIYQQLPMVSGVPTAAGTTLVKQTSMNSSSPPSPQACLDQESRPPKININISNHSSTETGVSAELQFEIPEDEVGVDEMGLLVKVISGMGSVQISSPASSVGSEPVDANLSCLEATIRTEEESWNSTETDTMTLQSYTESHTSNCSNFEENLQTSTQSLTCLAHCLETHFIVDSVVPEKPSSFTEKSHSSSSITVESCSPTSIIGKSCSPIRESCSMSSERIATALPHTPSMKRTISPIPTVVSTSASETDSVTSVTHSAGTTLVHPCETFEASCPPSFMTTTPGMANPTWLDSRHVADPTVSYNISSRGQDRSSLGLEVSKSTHEDRLYNRLVLLSPMILEARECLEDAVQAARDAIQSEPPMNGLFNLLQMYIKSVSSQKNFLLKSQNEFNYLQDSIKNCWATKTVTVQIPVNCARGHHSSLEHSYNTGTLQQEMLSKILPIGYQLRKTMFETTLIPRLESIVLAEVISNLIEGPVSRRNSTDSNRGAGTHIQFSLPPQGDHLLACFHFIRKTEHPYNSELLMNLTRTLFDRWLQSGVQSGREFILANLLSLPLGIPKHLIMGVSLPDPSQPSNSTTVWRAACVTTLCMLACFVEAGRRSEEDEVYPRDRTAGLQLEDNGWTLMEPDFGEPDKRQNVSYEDTLIRLFRQLNWGQFAQRLLVLTHVPLEDKFLLITKVVLFKVQICCLYSPDKVPLFSKLIMKSLCDMLRIAGALTRQYGSQCVTGVLWTYQDWFDSLVSHTVLQILNTNKWYFSQMLLAVPFCHISPNCCLDLAEVFLDVGSALSVLAGPATGLFLGSASLPEICPRLDAIQRLVRSKLGELVPDEAHQLVAVLVEGIKRWPVLQDMASGFDILGEVGTAHPYLFSQILLFMRHLVLHQTSSDLKKVFVPLINLAQSIPLADWIPMVEDMETIREFLILGQVESVELRLGCAILTRMDFEHSKNCQGQLFMKYSPIFHRTLALMLLEVYTEHVLTDKSDYKDALGWTGQAFKLASMSYKIIKDTLWSRSSVKEWIWTIMLHLKLHCYEWEETSDKPDFAMDPSTVPSCWTKDTYCKVKALEFRSLDLIKLKPLADLLAREDPLACYVAFQVLHCSEGEPEFLKYGPKYLQRLVPHHQLAAARCIRNMVAANRIDQTDLQADSFQTILAQLLHASDQSRIQGFLSFFQTAGTNSEFCLAVLKSACSQCCQDGLHCTLYQWMKFMTSFPSLKNDSAYLQIMDSLCRLSLEDEASAYTAMTEMRTTFPSVPPTYAYLKFLSTEAEVDELQKNLFQSNVYSYGHLIGERLSEQEYYPDESFSGQEHSLDESFSEQEHSHDGDCPCDGCSSDCFPNCGQVVLKDQFSSEREWCCFQMLYLWLDLFHTLEETHPLGVMVVQRILLCLNQGSQSSRMLVLELACEKMRNLVPAVWPQIFIKKMKKVAKHCMEHDLRLKQGTSQKVIEEVCALAETWLDLPASCFSDVYPYIVENLYLPNHHSIEVAYIKTNPKDYPLSVPVEPENIYMVLRELQDNHYVLTTSSRNGDGLLKGPSPCGSFFPLTAFLDRWALEKALNPLLRDITTFCNSILRNSIEMETSVQKCVFLIPRLQNVSCSTHSIVHTCSGNLVTSCGLKQTVAVEVEVSQVDVECFNQLSGHLTNIRTVMEHISYFDLSVIGLTIGKLESNLERMLTLDNEFTGETLTLLKSTGMGVILWLLNNVEESLLNLVLYRKLFTSWISTLETKFCTTAEQRALLVKLLKGKPFLSQWIIPLVNPMAERGSFVMLYRQTMEVLSPKNSDVYLSLLSKFSVRAWMESETPSISELTEVCEAVVTGMTRLGSLVVPDHAVYLTLHRHLQDLLHIQNNPLVFRIVHAMFGTLSGPELLPSRVWTDITTFLVPILAHFNDPVTSTMLQELLSFAVDQLKGVHRSRQSVVGLTYQGQVLELLVVLLHAFVRCPPTHLWLSTEVPLRIWTIIQSLFSNWLFLDTDSSQSSLVLPSVQPALRLFVQVLSAAPHLDTMGFSPILEFAAGYVIIHIHPNQKLPTDLKAVYVDELVALDWSHLWVSLSLLAQIQQLGQPGYEKLLVRILHHVRWTKILAACPRGQRCVSDPSTYLKTLLVLLSKVMLEFSTVGTLDAHNILCNVSNLPWSLLSMDMLRTAGGAGLVFVSVQQLDNLDSPQSRWMELIGCVCGLGDQLDCHRVSFLFDVLRTLTVSDRSGSPRGSPVLLGLFRQCLTLINTSPVKSWESVFIGIKRLIRDSTAHYGCEGLLTTLTTFLVRDATDDFCLRLIEPEGPEPMELPQIAILTEFAILKMMGMTQSYQSFNHVANVIAQHLSGAVSDLMGLHRDSIGSASFLTSLCVCQWLQSGTPDGDLRSLHRMKSVCLAVGPTGVELDQAKVVYSLYHFVSSCSRVIRHRRGDDQARRCLQAHLEDVQEHIQKWAMPTSYLQMMKTWLYSSDSCPVRLKLVFIVVDCLIQNIDLTMDECFSSKCFALLPNASVHLNSKLRACIVSGSDFALRTGISITQAFFAGRIDAPANAGNLLLTLLGMLYPRIPLLPLAHDAPE